MQGFLLFTRNSFLPRNICMLVIATYEQWVVILYLNHTKDELWSPLSLHSYHYWISYIREEITFIAIIMGIIITLCKINCEIKFSTS